MIASRVESSNLDPPPRATFRAPMSEEYHKAELLALVKQDGNNRTQLPESQRRAGTGRDGSSHCCRWPQAVPIAPTRTRNGPVFPSELGSASR